MKVVISAIIAAFAFISVPALAAADKVASKVDCKDAKNKDHADCKKKKEFFSATARKPADAGFFYGAGAQRAISRWRDCSSRSSR